MNENIGIQDHQRKNTVAVAAGSTRDMVAQNTSRNPRIGLSIIKRFKARCRKGRFVSNRMYRSG